MKTHGLMLLSLGDHTGTIFKGGNGPANLEGNRILAARGILLCCGNGLAIVHVRSLGLSRARDPRDLL